MHLMLVHVNNHDDSRLVPEKEERGGQILSEILPNTGAVYLLSAEFGCLADAVGSLTNRRDQYRAAEVFERIFTYYSNTTGVRSGV